MWFNWGKTAKVVILLLVGQCTLKILMRLKEKDLKFKEKQKLKLLFSTDTLSPSFNASPLEIAFVGLIVYFGYSRKNSKLEVDIDKQ